MPEPLDRCVQSLIAKGQPEDRAWAICKAATGLSEQEAETHGIAMALADIPEDAWTAAKETYQVARQRLGASHETALKKAHELPRYLGWEHVESVGWVRNFQAPQARSVLNVPIFAAGEHTDSEGNTRTWSIEDLDTMIRNSQAGVPERRPLKAGHTSTAFNQSLAAALSVPEGFITGEQGHGQVSLGNVTNLRRIGNVLMADFQDVPEPVADMVQLHGESGFTDVSSEIMDTEVGPAIVAVALLGSEDPAVPIATLEGALVMAAPNKSVLRFTRHKDGSLTQAEADLEAIERKVREAAKDTKSAGVITKLFTQMRQNLKSMFAAESNINREAEMLEKFKELFGLGNDATEDAVFEKVKALHGKHQEDEDEEEKKRREEEEMKKRKHAEGKADFSKSAEYAEFTKALQERDKRIEALEHDKRVASFSARVAKWKDMDKAPTAEKLAALPDEQANAIAEAWDATAEARETARKEASLFTSVSTPRAGGNGDNPDFEAEVKKHTDAGKTREQAEAAVAKSHPKLFRKYQADNIFVSVNGREG